MGRDKKLANKTGIWASYKFPLDIKVLAASKYEIYTAYVLQDCDKLYNALGVTRKEFINLEHLIPYPRPATKDNILSLIKDLSPTKWKNLDTSVTVLLKKLGLPSYWRLSLIILVLTHILPVPQKEPFLLYDPNMGIPSSFINPTGNPMLIFQAHFTPDELARWVKKKQNAHKLKKIGSILPGNFGRNRKEKEFTIARLIFILSEYEGKTFKDIAAYICDNYKKVGLAEKESDKYGDADVSRIYNRYKSIILNVYK